MVKRYNGKILNYLLLASLLIGLQLVFCSVSFAQNTVSGTVTDAGTGEPLPGVNIVIEGTASGTSTDANGTYELTVPSLNETLIFSYIGYQRQEVPIEGRTTLDIVLQSEAQLFGDELVVVGYTRQRAATISGAVGSISSEDLTNVSATNTASLLQGRVSGVTVTSGGGAPDAEATVVIRGTGTFGNDQPLYVIDGMITNTMSFINPSDIESIEVLKDASTAAIYGNRAANGVVIVTTKRGDDMPGVRVNFNSSIGGQTPTNTYDFLNARQYADHNNRMRDNDGLPRAPAYTAENFDPSIDTDWQDVQLNNFTEATVARNNLALSTGTENSSYFLSLEYLNRLGLVKEADFQRYGLRLNSDFYFDRFTVTQSISASREINNPNIFFGRERGALPVIPVYDENNLGGFAGVDPSFHGVARGINWYGVSVLNDQEIITDRVLGNIQTTYDIGRGFEYNLNVGINYGMIDNVNFMPAFFQSRSQEAFNDNANLTESANRTIGVLIENTVNYFNIIGNHELDILVGYTQENNRTRTASVSATNFPNNSLRTIDAAFEINNASGSLFRNVLQSGLGRVGYNYDNRYLLTGTFRADGSSRFAEGNRWGYFPSGSIGWRISEEAFAPDFFDELRIRASYGQLGSQNIADFATISGLNINADYFFAGGVQSGTALTNLSNPDVVWETSTNLNFGLDIAFLNNSISLSMDYFDNRSDGILVEVPMPVFGGVGSSVLTNAAEVKNNGLEFVGSYISQPRSDFSYSITGNFSIVRNEVLKLGEGVNPISGGNFTQQGFLATRTAPGRPIGGFYGFVVDGIYQNQEEIDADGRANAQPGDFRFRDINGDGQLTDADRTFIGDPHPDFEYGLSFNGFYKNLDFNLFIQGVQGNDVWNSKKFHFMLDNAGGNKITDVLDSWTLENRDTNVPRATFTDPANNKRPSTFFVEDGSYLRVKNLQVGYTLPSSVIQSLSGVAALDSVRFYFSGSNLFTITGYSGFDPEIGRNSGFRNTGLFGQGVDTNAHPQPRTLIVGIDISF